MQVIHSDLIESYIDLESISAITNAELICERGPRWVGFYIHLKLHDKPLMKVFKIGRDDEIRFGIESQELELRALHNGVEWWLPAYSIKREQWPVIVAIQRLQARIDQFAREWKQHGGNFT